MATISTGKFVWFDYHAKDLDKAKGFFGELFNWKTQDIPTPDGGVYTMITLDGQPIGGLMLPPPGAPENAMWLSSLEVPDARAAAAKVKSIGGSILKEAMAMGDFGTWALVADPQGGVFAVWQAAKAAGNGDYKGVTGAFCWNELVSNDPAKAVAFYTQLGFGVQTKEGEMGTYHMLTSDGKPRAGVLKSPMPEAPQAWIPYVQVASADQTVDKAKKLGSTVYLAPTDIAGVGRIAVIADSQGGVTGILQPATS